jgi:16S rRNA A1518/A1519 N6-dimethyltransferase RsmA/KsgA/DIM1 with predicted DNA glycosylase/AP lyase activity
VVLFVRKEKLSSACADRATVAAVAFASLCGRRRPLRTALALFLSKSLAAAVADNKSAQADPIRSERSSIMPLLNLLRAFPLFSESRKRSNLLFLRNFERKTAMHFCWNCSRAF